MKILVTHRKPKTDTRSSYLLSLNMDFKCSVKLNIALCLNFRQVISKEINFSKNKTSFKVKLICLVFNTLEQQYREETVDVLCLGESSKWGNFSIVFIFWFLMVARLLTWEIYMCSRGTIIICEKKIILSMLFAVQYFCTGHSHKAETEQNNRY